MNSWCLCWAILATIVSLTSSSPYRDPRGTFYVNNPIHSSCAGKDGRMGYCLFQGCFVNDLTYTGRCGFGLGSCCLAEQSCLRSSNVNNTYFVNPGFPKPTTSLGICEIAINRRTKNICQLRLDFIDFNLEQPNKDGHCYNDFFSVNGSKTIVSKLCGVNKGQHMYLDVDPLNNDDAVTLTVRIKELTLLPRVWNIKVTQIECSNQEKAPSGCLQYYSGAEGVVNSFNYGNTTKETKGTRQLANFSYSVCVRQEAGYCGITWSANKEVGRMSFAITGDVDAIPSLERRNLGTPALSSRVCPDANDFVLIPNGKDETGKLSERLCGLGFAKNVTTHVTPFIIHTKTNSDEHEDTSNTGYSLIFQQRNC